MDLLTEDQRAYMKERGVRPAYQDRTINDLEAVKDACDSGRLDPFMVGRKGLLLVGPGAHDATVLVGRWQILEGQDVLVTSAQELAERRADYYHDEEQYRTIVNEAGVLCVTDFQGEGDSPFTADQRHRVQRLVQGVLDEQRMIVLHARQAKLSWWAPWFREFLSEERFVRVVMNG